MAQMMTEQEAATVTALSLHALTLLMLTSACDSELVGGEEVIVSVEEAGAYVVSAKEAVGKAANIIDCAGA